MADGVQFDADQVRVVASNWGFGWSTPVTVGEVHTSRAPTPAYQPIRYALTTTGPSSERTYTATGSPGATLARPAKPSTLVLGGSFTPAVQFPSPGLLFSSRTARTLGHCAADDTVVVADGGVEPTAACPGLLAPEDTPGFADVPS